MAFRRRSRYLKCFYCGKRTSTPNDGRTRQFECPNCEATNYLDENGEITDPPVATTAAFDTGSSMLSAGGLATEQGHFNTPFASQQAGDASPTVFCKTCLKNQHLFVSSLAQYFPDDPEHPDMPELEHNYFRFRQGLERRYPQVCADCEQKVLSAIQQAGYTAKTDHLRRMVDYSRRVRLTRPTSLDLANNLGGMFWRAGFLLQFLWQVAVFADVLDLNSGGSMAAEESLGGDTIVEGVFSSLGTAPRSASPVPSALQPVLSWLLAYSGWLQSLCVVSTLACFWWNPYFVQTVRGFTKPFIGISTWYTFQAANALVRVMMAKVSSQISHGDAAGPPPTVLGVHVFAALFGIYAFFKAPRSIRKDMRPLFGKLPDIPLIPGPLPTTAEQRSEDERRGLETLSDVLDEISSSPTRHVASKSIEEDLYDTEGWDGWQPSPGASQNTFGQDNSNGQFGGGFNSYSVGRPRTSDFQLNSLQISGGDQLSPSQQLADYSEEMDWQPTQPTQIEPSQHRAFNTYNPNHNRFNDKPATSAGAFSQTPVEDNRGPFWYKVPQAPTSIAQRVLNPPNAPRLRHNRDNNTAKGAAAFFKRQDKPLNLDSGATAAGASSVEFAQPSFFAESTVRRGKDDDESKKLSDLFSQTFSLGSGNGGEEGSTAGQRSQTSGNARGRRRTSRPGMTREQAAAVAAAAAEQPSPVQRMLWLFLVLGSFVFLGALQLPDEYHEMLPRIRPYGVAVETASVGLCAVMAASLTAESVTRWRAQAMTRQMGRQEASSSMLPSFASVVLGLAGMGLAGWMGFQMWEATADETGGLKGFDRVEAAGHSSPWEWWQLALLHGTVTVHQIWNMAGH